MESFHLCAKNDNNIPINPDKVVFNFSSRLITNKEKEILSKGLNFAIPPTKLNHCNFFAPFDKFFTATHNESIYEHSGFHYECVKT